MTTTRRVRYSADTWTSPLSLTSRSAHNDIHNHVPSPSSWHLSAARLALGHALDSGLPKRATKPKIRKRGEPIIEADLQVRASADGLFQQARLGDALKPCRTCARQSQHGPDSCCRSDRSGVKRCSRLARKRSSARRDSCHTGAQTLRARCTANARGRGWSGRPLSPACRRHGECDIEVQRSGYSVPRRHPFRLSTERDLPLRCRMTAWWPTASIRASVPSKIVRLTITGLARC